MFIFIEKMEQLQQESIRRLSLFNDDKIEATNKERTRSQSMYIKGRTGVVEHVGSGNKIIFIHIHY